MKIVHEADLLSVAIERNKLIEAQTECIDMAGGNIVSELDKIWWALEKINENISNGSSN